MDDNNNNDHIILSKLLATETIEKPLNVVPMYSSESMGSNNTFIHGGVNISSLKIKNYHSTINCSEHQPFKPKVKQHQASKVLHLVESLAAWEKRVNASPKSYTQICSDIKVKFNFEEYETILAEQFEEIVCYLEMLVGRLAIKGISQQEV